jgi:glutamate 5-kinase
MTEAERTGEQPVGQERFLSKLIVIKIGSSTISRDGDPFNSEFMDDIARQVSELCQSGVKVVLVSSGAVAGGKKIVEEKPNQVSALFGQAALLIAWRDSFSRYNINNVPELLFTDKTRERDKHLLQRAINQGPVIVNGAPWNENTAFCADNDHLAGWIARTIGADTLLLLTDVEGVLANNSHHNPLPYVDRIEDILNDIQDTGTGTGGMLGKCIEAVKAARESIRSFIARANESDVILTVAKGHGAGTEILPGFALY